MINRIGAPANLVDTTSGAVPTPASGTVTMFSEGGKIKQKDSAGVVTDLTATGTGSLTDGDKGDITVSNSGGTWTIDDPLMTKAEPSYNNQPLFYTIEKFNTLQTAFYGTGTVTLETTIKSEGTGAMKISTVTANSTGPRLTLAAATSLLYKAMTIKCRASAWGNILTAQILFGNDGNFTNGYVWQWKGATNPKLVSPPDNEWIERTFNPGDCTIFAGAPNWGSITHIAIQVQASSGTPDFYVDDFKYFDSTQRPMVCVSFDDAIATQYSAAQAKLDAYNIRATFYTIWDLIGTATYMTEANVIELGNKGHDIAGHGQTNLSTLTQAQRITDLRGMKKMLVRLGFRGGDHYALPNGAFNDAIFNDISKYFSSIANVDWLSNTEEYAGNRMVNRFSPDSGTSTATIQAWIDNAIANNNMALITFHGIVASGATGAQVTQATYDTIIDYIGTKKNAGVLDTGTISDYFARPLYQNVASLVALTTEPPIPSVGRMLTYAKNVAGRMFLRVMGSDGFDTTLQAHSFFNTFQVIQAGSAAAFDVTGNAITSVGTISHPAIADTNLGTRTRRGQNVSVATAGGLASTRVNNFECNRNSGFTVVAIFKLDTLATGMRMFVGLTDTATTAPTNIDPTTSTTPGKIGMAINASTGNWNLVHNITGTAPTVIALGANFPVDTTTLYELTLYSLLAGTTVGYRIRNLTTNQILSGTLTTNLPALATLLGRVIWATNNATASAVAWGLGKFGLETDY